MEKGIIHIGQAANMICHMTSSPADDKNAKPCQPRGTERRVRSEMTPPPFAAAEGLVAEDRRTHRWNPLSYVSDDPNFRVPDTETPDERIARLEEELRKLDEEGDTPSGNDRD